MTGTHLIRASLGALLLVAVQVSAHGFADGITVYKQGAASGTYYKGYNPSYQYESPPPEVPEWSTPDDLQNTFIAGDKYTDPDIICHLGATNGALAVPVEGGDEVAIHWNTWPDSHKGPIIDALAKCDGPCQQADKTKLKFFKIGEQAQLDKARDFWAPNELIKNDLTWFVKIPTGIEPGNYVFRHEIVALHAAGQPNGAQNYPFCFNLAISTSGTDVPEGLEVTKWYKPSDNGIVWDLFSQKDADYPIVGPDNLYTGALLASQRMPKITATGTAISTLDMASLPAPTAKEDPVEEPAPTEETTTFVTATTALKPLVPSPVPEDPTQDPGDNGEISPTIIPPPEQPAPQKIYTTLVVTTLVTKTQLSTTTQFTTVQAPRVN